MTTAAHDVRVSLRTFDDSICAAYLGLFPGDPGKSADLLRWRFRDNPHGEARFATAAEGERIVGMIALMPTRLGDGTAQMSGYQAIDTAVHPNFRGKGLFVKMGVLAQNSLSVGDDVLWGFPNANAAFGWYGRLGWTDFGEVPLLMRPLRSSFLLGRVHPRLRSIDVPLVRGSKLSPEVYRDGAQLSRDVDGLWQQVAPTFRISVDRGGEWMRWRLLDKPGSSYRCVGTKTQNGGLGSFVAVKLAEKHGGRLCYVMEALGAPGCTADLSRLLVSELALAARSGAEAALAWCPPSAPNYGAYRKAGFLPVPPRLRPIEINFGARALRDESAAAAAPGARWYVSFLDSDTN